MINIAIVLFALSAVLGLTILVKWLTKKNASKAVIYSHGLVAAAALVLLILYAIQNRENFPQTSIVLFVLAALGGFYMFIMDLQKKASPLAIAFIHALLAVTGLVTLLLFAFADTL
jgi:hypothetical protein